MSLVSFSWLVFILFSSIRSELGFSSRKSINNREDLSESVRFTMFSFFLGCTRKVILFRVLGSFGR